MNVSFLETFKCKDNDKQKHDASSEGSFALSAPPHFPWLSNRRIPCVLQKHRGRPGPHSFSLCPPYPSEKALLLLDKIFSWYKSWGFGNSSGLGLRCQLRTHHRLHPQEKFRRLGATRPGSVPIWVKGPSSSFPALNICHLIIYLSSSIGLPETTLLTLIVSFSLLLFCVESEPRALNSPL